MTNKQLEIIENKKESEYKQYSPYQKKFLKENYEKFIKYCNYNFDGVTIKKNVGDEARTFHVLNKSIPLLSPSRIAKIFTEHQFWSIPKINLTKPRLFGQCAHKLLEMYLMTKDLTKLDKELLESWFPVDYELLKKELGNEMLEFTIDDINDSVASVIKFLKDNNIEVLQVEKHIANEMFHGYVDVLAIKRYANSNMVVPMIIDLKFSSMKEIAPSWTAQLAIYNEIMNGVAQCYILAYDRNTKICRLENINYKSLDYAIDAIKNTINLFRKGIKFNEQD